MPIVKVNDFVGFYRHLAAQSDVHALSGRGDEFAATEFASRRILEALDLGPEDSLLDVGCGDGCLLRLAEPLVQQVVGTVPNVEERLKLEREIPNVSFHVGVAQRLPLAAELFSRIVCNGVLILLGSEDAVVSALKEIARVARPQARVWLGEIPSADELSKFGKYKGNSVSGYLWHQLRRNGMRTFLGSVKEVGVALAGRHTLMLNSASIFYAPPEKFISMAAECGLRPVSHFKHQRLDPSGKIVESPYRYNYLFVK